MYNFKKFMAIACSATMLVSTPLTAFATEPTTTAGTGTIYAYSVDTVTVPTSVKIAFNPMGLEFDTGATEKVDDQIVSLNYGVASSSTNDRAVTVKFKAAATNGTEGEDIVFVDDIKKAQAYAASTNEAGAKKGEYKVYLAVAASTAAPTGADGTAFSKDNVPDADDLANVAMTAASEGLSAFEDGENAEIAYLLTKATYGLKAGENPSFDTTMNDFKGMMELKTLGGVVGFTFTGAMNPDADWTKAKASAVVITPTYKIEDATGEEELLDDEGGYQQIKAGAGARVLTAQSNGNLTYQFAEGSYPTGTLTAVSINGTGRAGQITKGNITYNATNGFFKIAAAAVSEMSLTQGNTTVVATIGDTEYTFKY